MKHLLQVALILLSRVFILSEGRLYKIPASSQQLSKQHFGEKLRQEYRDSLIATNYSEKACTWVEDRIAVELKQYFSSHYNHFLANISVGTPPQKFVVDVDFWASQDLSILNSKADLSRVQFGLPPKHTFNASASSSFNAISGNFSEGYYLNKGFLGNDIVQLGDLPLTNISFGLVDQIAWRYNSEPIDGILGISPHNSWQHIPNFLAQITNQLDKPIVSLFNNGNIFSNGSGQLTLGGEDLENCQSNWRYVPREGDRLGAHVTTVESLVNGEKLTASVNATLYIYPVMSGIQVPKRVFYLFANASRAVYNKTSKLYEADCDLSKAGNVTFNIGGSGDSPQQSSKQLVLTGSDYIRYKNIAKVCFVAVHGYDWIAAPGEDRMQFGKFFLDKFCIAYIYQTDEVGFASVRAKNDSARREDSKIAGGISLRRNKDLFIADITLGNPPQHFVAAVEYWSTTDLSVIGSKADLNAVSVNLPAKQTFDPSASKTFHPAAGRFSDDYIGNGIVGNDIATLGKLRLRNLTFGIIDKLGSAYKQQPIDAILGLSPDDSQNNIPNLLHQISVQLIRPVISLWTYSNMCEYGRGQLTLGAEDETHCKPNWIYVPKYGAGHSVYVSTVSTTIQISTTIEVSVKARLSIEPNAWMHVVPMNVLYLFTNASSAIYNTTTYLYVVDCDLRRAEDVVLNIGRDGKQLVLKPEDYISYMPYYKLCFVAVYGYFEEYEPDRIIELGQPFLNRHCMAYNIKKNEVGLADVKDEFISSMKF